MQMWETDSAWLSLSSADDSMDSGASGIKRVRGREETDPFWHDCFSDSMDSGDGCYANSCAYGGSCSSSSPAPLMPLGSLAGRVGLDNLGNTCFMSAGLQCLSHIEPFAAYFLTGAYRGEVNRENKLGGKGELAEAFAELQCALWQGESSSLDPQGLWRTLVGLAPHLFKDMQQQDIQEFLVFCLDGLHEDLNRVSAPPRGSSEDAEDDERLAARLGNDQEAAAALSWMRYLERGKSFVVDLFQGQLRCSLACTCCGYQSRRFEPFLYLSLPVARGMINLSDALQLFVEEELLSGSERWLCERCGVRVEARKKIDVWKLPPVLVIHLKRWSTTGGAIEKIDSKLAAPEDIDLSPFCSSQQSQGASYRVVSVANHVGVYGSGHYTATCRVGDRWYHFDDDQVRVLPDGEEAVGQHAYVVFLVRRSTEGGCYTRGHHAPLLKRQTLKNPKLWPHRLSDKALAYLVERRAGSSKASLPVPTSPSSTCSPSSSTTASTISPMKSIFKSACQSRVRWTQSKMQVPSKLQVPAPLRAFLKRGDAATHARRFSFKGSGRLLGGGTSWARSWPASGSCGSGARSAEEAAYEACWDPAKQRSGNLEDDFNIEDLHPGVSGTSPTYVMALPDCLLERSRDPSAAARWRGDGSTTSGCCSSASGLMMMLSSWFSPAASGYESSDFREHMVQ